MDLYLKKIKYDDFECMFASKNEKEYIISKVNNMIDFLQEIILLERLTGQEFSIYDFHIYDTGWGYNLSYKNIDMYFHINNFSIYIDFDGVVNKEELTELYNDIKFSKKVISIKEAEYKHIDTLKLIILKLIE